MLRPFMEDTQNDIELGNQENVKSLTVPIEQQGPCTSSSCRYYFTVSLLHLSPRQRMSARMMLPVLPIVRVISLGPVIPGPPVQFIPLYFLDWSLRLFGKKLFGGLRKDCQFPATGSGAAWGEFAGFTMVSCLGTSWVTQVSIS